MDDKWRTAKPLYPLNETVRNEFIKFILFFVATIYEISLFFKITPSIFWFSRREIGSIFIYHRVRRTRKIVDKSFHLWISKPRVRKILSKRRENENKNREWVFRRIFQWFFTQSTRRKTQRTSRFFSFSKSNARKNLRRRFEGDWRHRLSESRPRGAIQAGRIGRRTVLQEGESWSRLVDWKVNRKRIYTKHHDGYGYVSWKK